MVAFQNVEGRDLGPIDFHVSTKNFVISNKVCLFVKSKGQLFRVGDSDYSLKLICDCAITFVSQATR